MHPTRAAFALSWLLSALTIATVVEAQSCPETRRPVRTSRRALSPELRSAVLERARPLVRQNGGVIQSRQARRLMRQLSVNGSELMDALMEVGREHSSSAVSGVDVGAVARTPEGDLIVAGNLEFGRGLPQETLHGEQAAVAIALTHGLRIRSIMLAGAPCGHCRQVLNELEGGPQIQVRVSEQPRRRLSSLLPAAYRRRGTIGALAHAPIELEIAHSEPEINPDEPVVREAVAAAARAYTRGSPNRASGVVIMTRDGQRYAGSYMEVSGTNPSIPPLQAALANVRAAGKSFDDIERVVLAEHRESQWSHEAATRSIVDRIAPGATFQVIHVRGVASQSAPHSPE